MTTEKFNRIVQDRKDAISRTLQAKAKEYARDSDRLHNFKRAGVFMRQCPAAVCFAFGMKHLTSIADMVDDASAGKLGTIELWDEKVGDAINYLILLQALVTEARDFKGRYVDIPR
jgi:hypothetical protein